MAANRSPAPPAGRRRALVLAYDGRGYDGWQLQPGRASVQRAVEEALALTCAEPVRLHGSGRTDAGVHAEGQVAHFDAPPQRAGLNARAWLHALNTRLPRTVRVLAAHPVPADFHARFDAREKEYRYRLWLDGPMDPCRLGLTWAPGWNAIRRERLAVAAQHLAGRHDYSAFAANRADGSDPGRGEASVRTVAEIRLTDRGPGVELDFRGDGFHYRMVRLLVGAMVEFARGKLDGPELAALLDQPLDQPLRKSPFCAPADGLSLRRVRYPHDEAGREWVPHPWDDESPAEAAS